MFITRPENNLVGNTEACTTFLRNAITTSLEFSIYLRQINLSSDIKSLELKSQHDRFEEIRITFPRTIFENGRTIILLEEDNNSKNNNVKFNFTGETLFPFLPSFFETLTSISKEVVRSHPEGESRISPLLPVEETVDNALKSQGVLFYFPSDGRRIIINADVSSVMLGNNHAEILFRANNTL